MAWMKPISVAAALTLLSAPVFAQHTRGNGGGDRGGSRAQAEPRGGGEPRGAAPQRQEERGGAPQGQARGGENRSAQQAPAPPQRQSEAQGRAVPRTYQSAPPSVQQGRNNGFYGGRTAPNVAPAPNDRSYGNSGSRGRYDVPQSRGYNSYPQSRAYNNYPQSRGYNNYPQSRGYNYPQSRGYSSPRSYGGRSYGYGGYSARPRFAVPVVPYYRPYYTFRPRLSVGLGIFLGYPVPYPYSYGYPSYVYGAYGYGDSYYNDGPQSAPYSSVVPSQGSYGGISFDITPSDADIYIDDAYVGRAGDFSPMYQPLTVTPGRHQVELDAPDCEPLLFQVDIVAGQVLPYRGSLRTN